MKTRLLGIATALGLVAIALPARAQVILPPGDDGWQTPDPVGSKGSESDFTTSPIPAGFFGPGSDPFTGVMKLRGEPLSTTPPGALGATDTIVRRLQTANLPAPGSTAAVPIQMVALNLVSCQPFTVTYNGGQKPEPWVARASVCSPQPTGQMMITLKHQDGGTFNSFLPVQPTFTFTKLNGGPSTVPFPGPTISLGNPNAAWTVVGGPAGFNRAAHLIDPLPPGVTVAMCAGGGGGYVTSGSSNFQGGYGTAGPPTVVCPTPTFTSPPMQLSAEDSALYAHGAFPPGDMDGDRFPNENDNCPSAANPDQRDTDADGIGNVCDGSPFGLARLSEIYARHAGVQTLEFIELSGTPLFALTGWMVLIVNGDASGPGGPGTLAAAWDLTGNSVGANGFFTLGDVGVPGVDFLIAGPDWIPDLTETFYLVVEPSAADRAAILGLVGVAGGVDAEQDGVSRIPCLVDGVIESVALFDGGPMDRIYERTDSNTYGPVCATDIPPGISRAPVGDAWCPAFLDVDVAGNLWQPRTPDAPNSSCPLTNQSCLCVSPTATGHSYLGAGGLIPPTGTGGGTWPGIQPPSFFSSSVSVLSPVQGITAVVLDGITHTWVGDLHAVLRDPNGLGHNLFNRSGFTGVGSGNSSNLLAPGQSLTLVPSGGATWPAAGNIPFDSYNQDFGTGCGAGAWTSGILGIDNTNLAAITGPAGTWTLEIYDWSPSDTGSIAGWTMDVVETTSGGGTPMRTYCFPGLNGTLACPCGNPPSSTGKGCNNFGGGPVDSAELTATGTASIANDTLVFTATGENNASLTIFLQGPTQAPSGFVFGGGIRCIAGSLKRLYTGNASGGAISRPLGAPNVHTRSAALGDIISGGQTRYYMAYYRDPLAAGPCSNPASTFNSSQSGKVAWTP